jgi:hypothetical protein
MDELENGELRDYVLSEWNKVKQKALNQAIDISKSSKARTICFPLFIGAVLDSVSFCTKKKRFTHVVVSIGTDGIEAGYIDKFMVYCDRVKYAKITLLDADQQIVV